MISTYSRAIQGLREDYWYGRDIDYTPRNARIRHAFRTIENQGFIGSDVYLKLYSSNKIEHLWGSCIAAPRVTCAAAKALYLGVNGSALEERPFRIYAPEQLSLVAPDIVVGDIEIMGPIDSLGIYCQRITFCKDTDEDPEVFEIIKSWLSDRYPPEILHCPLNRERASVIL